MPVTASDGLIEIRNTISRLNMPLPPNLFLIGGQKCATTMFAQLLGKHPDICLQDGKESGFFAHNFDKGRDWYFSLYSNPDAKYLLDASVTYSQADLSDDSRSSRIPARIQSMRPDAKFIYIVRNPSERTYSAYWHMRRIGREERLFFEALEQERDYLDTSDYAGQLEAYLRFFSRDQFLVLRYDKLLNDPRAFLQECHSFLRLAPIEIEMAELTTVRNKGFQFTFFGAVLRKCFSSNASFKVGINKIKRLVPSTLKPYAANLVRKDLPTITAQERQYLDEYFQPKIIAFETLTGMDFSAWKRPAKT